MNQRKESTAGRPPAGGGGVTPPEAPPKTNPARRLAGVIVSPGQTFREINLKPTWLAPLVIAVAAALAGSAFYSWRVSPDWEQRVLARIEEHRETTGQVMTPDQVGQQLALARTMGKLSLVLPAVQLPLFCLVVAGLCFVGFGMVFLAAPPFRKVFAVVVWSVAANRVIGTVVLVAVLLLSDRESLQSADSARAKLVLADLGTFLPSDAPAVVRSLASSVNLFTIWFLVMVVVGFTRLGDSHSRPFAARKVAALVFGLWAAWTLTKAALALGFGY